MSNCPLSFVAALASFLAEDIDPAKRPQNVSLCMTGTKALPHGRFDHVLEFVAVKTFGDFNCCFRAASLILFAIELNHLELNH